MGTGKWPRPHPPSLFNLVVTWAVAVPLRCCLSRYESQTYPAASRLQHQGQRPERLS